MIFMCYMNIYLVGVYSFRLVSADKNKDVGVGFVIKDLCFQQVWEMGLKADLVKSRDSSK